MSSASIAAASIAAASAVGDASARPWVSVKNGTQRTLTTTRSASRPSSATSPATRAASEATSARTTVQSARSCWKVTSRPSERLTYGELLTVALSRPVARRCNHGPVAGPNRAASASTSASARPRTVVIPSSVSLAAVLAPIPHSAVVGCSPSRSNQLAPVMRKTPAGLP